jgi:hypothetical protein
MDSHKINKTTPVRGCLGAMTGQRQKNHASDGKRDLTRPVKFRPVKFLTVQKKILKL